MTHLKWRRQVQYLWFPYSTASRSPSGRKAFPHLPCRLLHHKRRQRSRNTSVFQRFLYPWAFVQLEPHSIGLRMRQRKLLQTLCDILEPVTENKDPPSCITTALQQLDEAWEALDMLPFIEEVWLLCRMHTQGVPENNFSFPDMINDSLYHFLAQKLFCVGNSCNF